MTMILAAVEEDEGERGKAVGGDGQMRLLRGFLGLIGEDE